MIVRGKEQTMYKFDYVTVSFADGSKKEGFLVDVSNDVGTLQEMNANTALSMKDVNIKVEIPGESSFLKNGFYIGVSFLATCVDEEENEYEDTVVEYGYIFSINGNIAQIADELDFNCKPTKQSQIFEFNVTSVLNIQVFQTGEPLDVPTFQQPISNECETEFFETY